MGTGLNSANDEDRDEVRPGRRRVDALPLITQGVWSRRQAAAMSQT